MCVSLSQHGILEQAAVLEVYEPELCPTQRRKARIILNLLPVSAFELRVC